MATTDRQRATRNIIIFTALMSGLAWGGAQLGGTPKEPGLGLLVWGAAIVPDSAQFSALIADHAPPHLVGSLMAMQTALGFALTIVTVQATPMLAAALGWPLTLAVMAFGPAFGIRSLRRVWGRGQAGVVVKENRPGAG